MNRRLGTVRLRNLELLINEAGSAAQLARIAGTNSSYLSQIRHRMPTQSGKPRRIGDDLAEKLERGMEKPEGWMDEPRDAAHLQQTASAESGSPGRHPLISWVQAREWPQIAKNYVPQPEDEQFPCPVDCSDESYVLRVRGVSMEPKFHDGELIFVDPKIPPAHGKYVVVRLDDSSEATFKQFIVEGDALYLKSLNPDWPKPIIEIDSDTTICGAVVFKGEALVADRPVC